MPGLSHQCIGPIHQYLAIPMHSIQRLLLLLQHISLMPELNFQGAYPIQHLLQQILRICCLSFISSVALGAFSEGIMQISNLVHAV